MSKKLKDNVSSGYFEAANRLRSKKAKRRIVAYVESYDDVFFWRSILSAFESDKLCFEVMLPARTEHLERGKKAVIMQLAHHVGQDMIACVDADYDYLIQGATPTSQNILENPYIFHTYAYSIENLQCYAPSLRDVCVAVTLNDRSFFDIQEYLRQFSQAIFPLFIWNVWYYRTPDYKQFTMTDFLRIIETGNFSVAHAEEIIQNVRRKVGKKIQQLQQQHPDGKENYLKTKESLKQLGVTADTTYLYIQGHHLFEKVVVPMLTKICDQLVRERENEIQRQSLHNTQRRNELSCYTNSVSDIPSILKKNVSYVMSEPVKRIREDIGKFLQTSSQQTSQASSPDR